MLGTQGVVILACAVDAADKGLLPATFKALSLQLDIGAKGLGLLTFAQSVTFSVALPVWGSLLRFHCARDLLVFGCLLWAAATFCIALSSTFWTHFALRLVNGAALAAVSPLAQALLCDIVPEAHRGRAFGLVSASAGVMSMLSGFVTTGIATSMVAGIRGWRLMHIVVALASVGVAALVHRTVPAVKPPALEAHAPSWFSEQREVVKKILTKPSFVILVLQGVTGGIPWNGFAFLTLYFQLSGYTDWQASMIGLAGGIGGACGGYLGGVMGDFFSHYYPSAGRIAVAQVSVVSGIVCFLWFMSVPFGPGSFVHVSIAVCCFHLTGSWTPAAACRPICGSIFRDSRDRAQVLALWIALEGLVAAICGAPLAGVLSETFGFRLEGGHGAQEGSQNASVDALRKALLGVALIPWSLCALAWFLMYWAYPRDRCQEEAEGGGLACARKKGKPLQEVETSSFAVYGAKRPMYGKVNQFNPDAKQIGKPLE